MGLALELNSFPKLLTLRPNESHLSLNEGVMDLLLVNSKHYPNFEALLSFDWELDLV